MMLPTNRRYFRGAPQGEEERKTVETFFYCLLSIHLLLFLHSNILEPPILHHRSRDHGRFSLALPLRDLVVALGFVRLRGGVHRVVARDVHVIGAGIGAGVVAVGFSSTLTVGVDGLGTDSRVCSSRSPGTRGHRVRRSGGRWELVGRGLEAVAHALVVLEFFDAVVMGQRLAPTGS